MPSFRSASTDPSIVRNGRPDVVVRASVGIFGVGGDGKSNFWASLGPARLPKASLISQCFRQLLRD